MAPASFPVSVHAANGTVRVTSRPTAIVSLSPTATEMLYAIGAGSQVKAVDLNSDYPPGVPRTQLDGNNPNVEAIANYKPDLVVASDEPTSVDSQLGALGIPVVSDPAATNLSQEYAAVRGARQADRARGPGTGRGGQDQEPGRPHRAPRCTGPPIR